MVHAAHLAQAVGVGEGAGQGAEVIGRPPGVGRELGHAGVSLGDLGGIGRVFHETPPDKPERPGGGVRLGRSGMDVWVFQACFFAVALPKMMVKAMPMPRAMRWAMM